MKLKLILISFLIGLLVIGSTLIYIETRKNPLLFANFSSLVFTEQTKKEIECLADNIFFESAYEPYEGKKAVAFVTLNRVKSKFYPDSICEVVKQKTTRVCQFSWYCEETPKRLSYTKNLTPAQKKVYNEIYELAIHVYVNDSYLIDPTNGALFYHADYVNPGWRNMKHTATIGRHIFYIRKDML
jgi:spore germination cell wall hydrolase CwlJ-like protein